MEPDGSFPCSQEPSTGPYPELDNMWKEDRYKMLHTGKSDA
jgi:hypothetical protein